MQDGSKVKAGARYTPDFRRSVLERMASGGTSLRKISEEVGVSVPTLIKWRKEEGATHKEPRASVADDEIRRLREEIDRLREERDRLRLGIAYLVGVKISE